MNIQQQWSRFKVTYHQFCLSFIRKVARKMGRDKQSTITVEMLKKSLKSLNLSQCGNKDVLIERLGWAELNSIELVIFEEQIFT